MAESDRARAAFEANKARFAQRENEAAGEIQKRATLVKMWLVGAAGVIGFVISTSHALLSFSTIEDLSIVFTAGPIVSADDGGAAFSDAARGFLINSGDEPIAVTAMGFSVHKSNANDPTSRECTKSMKDIPWGDPEMLKGNSAKAEVAWHCSWSRRLRCPGRYFRSMHRSTLANFSKQRWPSVRQDLPVRQKQR